MLNVVLKFNKMSLQIKIFIKILYYILKKCQIAVCIYSQYVLQT